MEEQPKAKPPGINQYVDRVIQKPEATEFSPPLWPLSRLLSRLQNILA
jgi:hypothetical protein